MKRPYTEADIATMRRISKRGGTRHDAARALDRTPASISFKANSLLIRFRKLSGDRRKGVRISDNDAQCMMLMREIGYTGPEIAEIYGVSVSYVGMICRGERRATEQ